MSGDGLDGHRASSFPWARFAFLGLLAFVALVRIRSVFTQGLNWDEFALLQRAVTTAGTGVVEGGGRPGLATLVLVPFADGCRLAVDALVEARILWTALVFAGGTAFWLLLRRVLPPTKERGTALALGLGLWVMSPVFLLTSTQVRSDQPAFVFALLGGAALLASRCRLAWAPAAGALMALGFLFSQKAAYVIALVGALALAQLLVRQEWRPGREIRRGVLAGASFFLCLAAYAWLVRWLGSDPILMPPSGQLGTFQFYREMVGWREYRQMLPLLLPQFVALAGLMWVTADRLLRDRRGGADEGRQMWAAWGALALGGAVLFFHAGRFAYFYMTLGLFPATVGALVAGPVLRRLERPILRRGVLGVTWALVATGVVLVAPGLARDHLGEQRSALEFVERNFSPEARGYDGVGVFACRADPAPFPVRFAEHVWALYAGVEGAARGRELIREFRKRPVAFMMLPLEAESYPSEVRAFWDTRYLPYHGEIRVPGREVAGEAGWSGSFEVLVPGEYRWRTPDDAWLEVGGNPIPPGGTLRLEGPGPHSLGLPEGGKGTLVLALEDPPARISGPFFRGF